MVVNADVENEDSFDEICDDPVQALLLNVVDGISPVPANLTGIGNHVCIVQDELWC